MPVLLPILLLAATPAAAAQIWDGGRSAGTPAPERHDTGVGRDLSDIDRSIRDGRRNGELTRSEARALRGQSASIERLSRQYRAGGPISADTSHLQQMTLVLRGMVEAQRSATKPSK